jgi:hypothetical protein
MSCSEVVVLGRSTDRRSRFQAAGMKRWLEIRNWPRWLRRLALAWDYTPTWLRWLSLMMWLAGLVLVVLGSIGDSHGFWSSRPFQTNLVSSFTGALFGIPFVLVILQQITNAQADRQQARAAQRLAARVSREMLNAALDMVQDPPAAMTALSELAEREDQQRLDPDKEGRAWANMIKPCDEFDKAGEKLWERWDSLQGAVHDRILEVGGRWAISEEQVANLKGFRKDELWKSLAGGTYAQGNARNFRRMIRIIHTIAIDFNAGDPLRLRFSKNGPIPDCLEKLHAVDVDPDI